MMYPFCKYADETTVVFSEITKNEKDEEVIYIHFERPTENGFDSVRFELPSYNIVYKEGNYTQEEMAIGLKSKNGPEILMHVGIDTVNLQGKYFSPQIQVNEEVRKGQLLLTFDLDKIKEEGYDTTTPIIITNSKNFSSIQIEKQSTTQHGNKLISLD